MQVFRWQLGRFQLSGELFFFLKIKKEKDGERTEEEELWKYTFCKSS